jgi:hypothetical protein
MKTTVTIWHPSQNGQTRDVEKFEDAVDVETIDSIVSFWTDSTKTRSVSTNLPFYIEGCKPSK